MIHRKDYISEISQSFEVHPVVGLLGPRQSGKTTLAREYVKSLGSVHLIKI